MSVSDAEAYLAATSNSYVETLKASAQYLVYGSLVLSGLSQNYLRKPIAGTSNTVVHLT